jgi:alcohol dehydrogenase YqhD (iron-dependent ADH family)
MKNFDLHMPTRIIFGPGQLSRLGKEAAKIGRRAVVVTGRHSAKESGVLDRTLGLLKEAGVSAVVFDRVEPNPRSTTIDDGGALARSEGCDVVIGLGGGSAMDAAKGVAVAAYDPGNVWDYVRHGDPSTFKVPKQALPIVLVPTLAATGSEFNAGSVITNWETHEKALLIVQPLLFAKVSIIDPELTLTVDKNYTTDGAIDIVLHVMESYFNNNESTPLQDRISEGIILTVMEYFPRLLTDLRDLDARSELSWSSAMALCGIPGCGREPLGFPVHAMEHALSGHYDISHGRGLAIIVPHWMEYSYKRGPGRFAQFAERVMGLSRQPGESQEKLAARGISAWTSWMKEHEAYYTLRDVGIDETRFEAMAADTARIYGDGKTIGGVRPLGIGDMVEIYRMCLG